MRSIIGEDDERGGIAGHRDRTYEARDQRIDHRPMLVDKSCQLISPPTSSPLSSDCPASVLYSLPPYTTTPLHPSRSTIDSTLVPFPHVSFPMSSTPAAASSATKSSEESTQSSPATESSSSPPSLKSSAVFKAIEKRINAETVKKVKAAFRFDISPDGGGAPQSWVHPHHHPLIGSSMPSQAVLTRVMRCVVLWCRSLI